MSGFVKKERTNGYNHLQNPMVKLIRISNASPIILKHFNRDSMTPEILK